jgi:YHS domain-containing protein
MRVMMLGMVLAALAACSTEGRLLAPDPEAAKMVSPEHRPSGTEREVVDLVCGAPVDLSEVTWRSSYEGQEYFFDSEECKKAFDADPKLFVPTAR